MIPAAQSNPFTYNNFYHQGYQNIPHLYTVFNTLHQYCKNNTYALSFSNTSSIEIPCTIQASSRDSICDDGHPIQCMPLLRRISDASGFNARISAIIISLVITINPLSGQLFCPVNLPLLPYRQVYILVWAAPFLYRRQYCPSHDYIFIPVSSLNPHQEYLLVKYYNFPQGNLIHLAK